MEQIGVEPGAELQRLHEQILAHDPALDLPAAAEPERRARPRRRSRALLVGAAALVIAGVLAFGIIRVLEPDTLAGIGENSVGLLDPDGVASPPSTRSVTARMRSPPAPARCGSPTGSTARSRASTATAEVTTIDVGGAPAALAFGAGSLWVADGDAREVAQVDPGSNKVARVPGRQRAALAGARGGRAVGGLRRRGRVHRDRPRRRHAARDDPLGAKASAIAAGAGALWVASEEAGTVTASTRAAGAWSRRSPSATPRAPSRWAKARCGSPTAPTGRWRASIRSGTR